MTKTTGLELLASWRTRDAQEQYIGCQVLLPTIELVGPARSMDGVAHFAGRVAGITRLNANHALHMLYRTGAIGDVADWDREANPVFFGTPKFVRPDDEEAQLLAHAEFIPVWGGEIGRGLLAAIVEKQLGGQAATREAELMIRDIRRQA